MDEDIPKKARNLSVTSFVVVIYVLGDAHFKHDGSLLGGSVTFGNTVILEYAGLALLFFYLYMYILFRSHTRGIFYNWRIDIDSLLQQSASFRRYIEELGMAEIRSCMDNNREINGQLFYKEGDNYPVKAVWFPQQSHIIRKTFSRMTSVSAISEKTPSRQTSFGVRLSWWRCLSAEMTAALKAAMLRQNFFNDVFPVVLCLVAIFLVLMRWLGYL